MSLTVDVVFACGNESVLLPNGQTVRVMPGQHWPANDPLVRARPQLFTSDSRFGMLYTEPRDEYDPAVYPPVYEIGPDVRLEREDEVAPDAEDEPAERDAPDVEDASAAPEAEQATAAPGEKRSVRRRRAEPAEVTL